MRRYNDAERQFLCENIPGRSYSEIAELFNAWLAESGSINPPITTAQVNSFCGNNKISTGHTGRFPRGNVPHNKGLRGIRPSPATEFKKGHRPHNHRPVGSTRVNKDGYTEIKIAEPKKWKALHLLVWEQNHGSVPKGYAVIFGDGNKQNTSIDNLVLVSRAQLVRMNQKGLIGGTAELTKTGAVVAELMNKIGEKKRGQRKNAKRTDN